MRFDSPDRRDDEPRFNVMPMIDVMLLLLVFFMMVTRFLEPEQEIDVRLPRIATAQQPGQGLQPLIVNVKKDGTMMVHDKAVTMDELQALLNAARAQNPEQAVLVRGDENAAYGQVAKVLGLCRGAGIGRSVLGVVEEGH